MAELSALALTLGRVLAVINRRHWRHRLPRGRGQALQSQFNKGPRREIFEELDMLCTSRERQHTVSAEIRRSAGLLHLVCIPQPATGGKWLVENSTFAPFRIDEGRDKGRVPSISVELAIKKKRTLCYFRLKVIEVDEWTKEESAWKYTRVPDFHSILFINMSDLYSKQVFLQNPINILVKTLLTCKLQNNLIVLLWKLVYSQVWIWRQFFTVATKQLFKISAFRSFGKVLCERQVLLLAQILV